MSVIERQAKLFEAGEYPDKGISVTEDDLDRIAAGTIEAPLKLQHTDTPFDGAMGKVKALIRKGAELWGTVAFTPEAYALAQKAGATALSVAITRAKNGLREVSLVSTPRIEGAAYFAEGGDIEIVSALGPALFAMMPFRDMEDLINKQINSDGSKGRWVHEMTAKQCIVSEPDGRYTRYDYTIDGEEVTLKNPVKVKHKSSWIADDAHFDQGDPEMEITQAEFDALKAKADKVDTVEAALTVQASVVAEQTAKFTKFDELIGAMDTDIKAKDTRIGQLESERKADAAKAKVDGLIRAGKLAPASIDFAMRLFMLNDTDTVKFGDSTMSVADALDKLFEKQPAVLEFEEKIPASGGDAVEFTGELAEKLGISCLSKDRVAELQKKYRIRD